AGKSARSYLTEPPLVDGICSGDAPRQLDCGGAPCSCVTPLRSRYGAGSRAVSGLAVVVFVAMRPVPRTMKPALILRAARTHCRISRLWSQLGGSCSIPAAVDVVFRYGHRKRASLDRSPPRSRARDAEG